MAEIKIVSLLPPQPAALEQAEMALYPPIPKGVRVFWDNGKWVAIYRSSEDIAKNRMGHNLAGTNAHTKKRAILDARAALDLEVLKYETKPSGS